MRNTGRLIVLLVVLLAAFTVSACSRDSPLCRTADGLLDAGRLAAAAEVYAHAGQQGEGSCADEGLTAVGERYTAAFRAVAAGSSAELAGDPSTAGAQYEVARSLDVGNEPAAAGLRRLGRDVATSDSPVTVSPAPPAPGLAWPWVLGGGLGLAAGLVALAVLGHRRLRRVEATSTSTTVGMRGLAAPAPLALGSAEDVLDRPAESAAERGLALREAVRRHETQLEEIVDFLDGFSTDQLRLLASILERTGLAHGLPDQVPDVLVHWVRWSRDQAVDVADEDEPADQLLIHLVVAGTEDDGESPCLVYSYRVEAVRVDLASVVCDEAFVAALAELTADPDNHEELAAAMQAHAVDACGWRMVGFHEDDCLPVSGSEEWFWRSWCGSAVLVWTRRVSLDLWRTEVCTLARPTVSAGFASCQKVLGALVHMDAADDETRQRLLADFLRSRLEQTLLAALTARGLDRIAPAPRGHLVQVQPNGDLRVLPTEDALAAPDPPAATG